MTDARLRELERRWRTSGAVDDEAAYLLERVRTGDLTQRTLHLAAHFLHEGAISARRSVPLTSSCCEEEPNCLLILQMLNIEGEEAMTRFGISIAATALCSCQDKGRGTYSRTTDLLSMIIRRVLSISPVPSKATIEHQASLLQTELHDDLGLTEDLTTALHATYMTAQIVCAVSVGARAAHAHQAIEFAQRGSERSVDDPRQWPRSILADLAAWALGNDPLPALLARLEAEANPITPPG